MGVTTQAAQKRFSAEPVSGLDPSQGFEPVKDLESGLGYARGFESLILRCVHPPLCKPDRLKTFGAEYPQAPSSTHLWFP
jgi:hypothetical protein